MPLANERRDRSDPGERVLGSLALPLISQSAVPTFNIIPQKQNNQNLESDLGGEFEGSTRTRRLQIQSYKPTGESREEGERLEKSWGLGRDNGEMGEG